MPSPSSSDSAMARRRESSVESSGANDSQSSASTVIDSDEVFDQAFECLEDAVDTAREEAMSFDDLMTCMLKRIKARMDRITKIANNSDRPSTTSEANKAQTKITRDLEAFTDCNAKDSLAIQVDTALKDVYVRFYRNMKDVAEEVESAWVTVKKTAHEELIQGLKKEEDEIDKERKKVRSRYDMVENERKRIRSEAFSMSSDYVDNVKVGRKRKRAERQGSAEAEE
ncbi:hypothetical protein K490DRAFT_60143 [Saccharata proteae CBS 121410]|uniref:Uncharacterized protein n=1 Tax=Saccharata proteae CBS 121410 TaxID=1314787 RepID=A0A9P4HNJ1_9PEZI|nr:hypothetical protein K490DRAFT_60143 [Saccharata proteae CBS 121410]